mmetsp:Transcript_47669/g.121634  ORF Transcript_47669/g.121634 Transcript_47669/m.121634 type:complete len:89 (-) Transcript_47669:549-815(-)
MYLMVRLHHMQSPLSYPHAEELHAGSQILSPVHREGQSLLQSQSPKSQSHCHTLHALLHDPSPFMLELHPEAHSLEPPECTPLIRLCL